MKALLVLFLLPCFAAAEAPQQFGMNPPVNQHLVQPVDANRPHSQSVKAKAVKAQAIKAKSVGPVRVLNHVSHCHPLV